MADDKKSEGGLPTSLIVIVVIVVLIALASNRNNNPSGERGLLREAVSSTRGEKSSTKARASKITLDGSAGAKQEDLSQEYIVIKADKKNSASINITGWELRSLSRFNLKIPAGVRILYTGDVNPTSAVVLNPGERAIVNSGRSPLGTSFRVNICSGYLNQYQKFTPQLDEKNCPDPRDREQLMINLGLSNSCIDYVESLPKCRYPERRLPSNLSSQCRDYIVKNLNYNACVAQNYANPNFFTGEWRVYLGQTRDIWKKSKETIFLTDNSHKLIDTLRY